MIKRAHDCQVEMSKRLNPENLRGHFCSRITEFNEMYTVRLGHTTLLTGYPSSGKSFFAFNIQCGLTDQHGWKHFIYSPEMGDAAEIYLTIMEIMYGKNRGFGLTEQVINSLLPVVHEHFIVYDPESSPTMEDLTKIIAEYSKKETVHTFLIDNLNDLRHNITGTQDVYFEQQMLFFNLCAKNNKIHGFLLAHPSKPQPDDLHSPPSPDKIKGGSAFWSKGQTILSLRSDGQRLEVACMKAKPRQVAKKGQVFFSVDFKRNTYSQYIGGAGVHFLNQTGHPEQKKAPITYQEPKDSYDNPSF